MSALPRTRAERRARLKVLERALILGLLVAGSHQIGYQRGERAGRAAESIRAVETVNALVDSLVAGDTLYVYRDCDGLTGEIVTRQRQTECRPKP